MSGAGKSQAMSAFEDEGWFCIDNLPPRMISSLVELSGLEGSHLDRVAVACDVRGGRGSTNSPGNWTPFGNLTA